MIQPERNHSLGPLFGNNTDRTKQQNQKESSDSV